MAEVIDYLTVKELATMLRISLRSTWRLTTDPSFPCLRIGRLVRFPRERVLDWLRKREQGFGRPKRIRKPVPSLADSQAESGNADPPPLSCASLCAQTAEISNGKAVLDGPIP